MTNKIQQTREHITKIAKYLFDRQLTDAAGGNISVRVDDKICMTSAYSGHSYQWDIQPEQVLVLSMYGKKLEGQGGLSRETKVHIALHRYLGEYGNAVIHCHARNMMVFAAASRPMPAVLEATLKYGEIPVSKFAPSHTDDLATNIVDAMRPQVNKIPIQAAGVIAPWHGLFAMGKDLNATFDAVECMDTNAYCIIMGQMLGASANLSTERDSFQKALEPYQSKDNSSTN